MAFVYRATKFKDLKDNDQIGPGSYLSQTSYSIKQNKFAFQSTAKRAQEILEHKITPGPGSYFKGYDEALKTEYDNLITSINQNEPLYKVLDYDELAKNSKYADVLNEKIHQTGFLKKDKRFPESMSNLTPGPGHYNRTDLNFHEENIKKIEKQNKKKRKKKEKLSQNDNLESEFKGAVSIPAKLQSYGYKVIGEGEIIRNDNKVINEVSPCSYDIFNYTKNQWHNKTLTSIWSRSKTNKGIQLSKKEHDNERKHDFSDSGMFRGTQTAPSTTLNFYEDRLYTQPQSESKMKKVKKQQRIIEDSEICNKKITMYNIIKANKERNKNIKPHIEERNKIEKLVNNELSELPGPGYYFSDINEPLKTQPESFQCFGSRTSRFNPFIQINNEDMPGPGSYFNEKQMRFNSKKNKLTKEAFKNPNTRVFSAKPKKSPVIIPGPGDYEPIFDSNLHRKKLFSQTKGIFGSTEQRFIKKHFSNEETRGPGAYLPVFTHKEKKENPYRVNLKKEKLSDAFKVENQTQSNTEAERVKHYPSIGSYDPDKIFNIETKLKKNINKISAVFAPFNSLQRRFEKSKKDKYKLNLGPGYYYKEKKIKVINDAIPFKSSSKKEVEFHSDNEIGVGNYNLTSYYDWNKKSYNMHFV